MRTTMIRTTVLAAAAVLALSGQTAQAQEQAEPLCVQPLPALPGACTGFLYLDPRIGRVVAKACPDVTKPTPLLAFCQRQP